MEQTIDRSGNVVVSTSTTSVSWDASWTHYDTTNYILEQIALRFTMGSGSGYSVKVSEQASGTWTSRLNAMDAANNGDTITLPLSAGSWENKTSGTLRALFYKRGTSQATYTNVSFVFTYRAKATASTITVVRTMAGEPQTVQITNTDPDVYHKVTWSYGSYQTHSLTSGELTYGAATRSPAWAVPAADLQYLYMKTTTSAVATGSVLVKTYAADGTYIGEVSATATLDIPETDDVKPSFGTETMSVTPDAVAQLIRAETNNPCVQGHTDVTLKYVGQPKYNASIASVTIITPDGIFTVANNTAKTYTLMTPGSYSVRVILTDSRGFTNEKTETLFTVQAYTAPVITSIQAVRSDDQGNEQPDGSYAWVEAVGVVTGNTEIYKATIKPKGGSQIGSAVTLTGGTAILPSTGTLNEDTSYVITVTLEDAYGVQGTAEIELGTGTVTISRMAGGKGVAFGKPAEKYGVEVNADWPVYMHGKEVERLIIDTVYPPGTVLSNVDPDFDPNTQWTWSRWGKVADDWVRGYRAKKSDMIGWRQEG